MDKFNRNYEISVQTRSGDTLSIKPPFTIEFDITRNTLTSANVCQVRLYNLSLVHRNQIRRNASDYGPPFQGIELKAGYGNNLPVIFTGNISQAWSVREGTNFITQIECYDGGFAFNNGTVSLQFPANTSQDTIIRAIAAQLPHTSVGSIGSYPGTTTRGTSYTGNPAQILAELTGGGFFIDKSKVNALGTDEYIPNPNGLLVINARSGLLGTPVLEQTICRFDIIFEPTLNVGNVVQLVSATEINFNGLYKVTAVKHRGMISEAVCGTVITTGEFYFSKALVAVPH